MKIYVVSKIGFTQSLKQHSSRTWEQPIYDDDAQVFIVAKEKRHAEAFFQQQAAQPFAYDCHANPECRAGEKIHLEEFDINPKNKLPGKFLANALFGIHGALKAFRNVCNDFEMLDSKASQDKEEPSDDDGAC